ncbi:MAG: carboxylating nicotinate-nucleotide diphosphorylase [Chloroflexi bacterium]|nr:carboxylating nicotinate-nucleotide diphosphorylase [Chloroflexota bacterium]
MNLPLKKVQDIIDNALDEDLGWGDVTTDALVPPDIQARADVIFKEDGVVAGLEVLARTFQTVDAAITVKELKPDGSKVDKGEVVAVVEGPAASVLKAERVALNFIQRLSGIATQTSRFVEEIGDLPAQLIHTRKTTPGLRILERYAVQCGGGHLHRYNLSDGVLVKDNHLVALKREGQGIKEAVALLRRRIPHTIAIEVEADTIDQVREAVEAGADVILFDNMSPEEAAECVKVVAGQARTEASGGIKLNTVRAYAQAGCDLVSSGSLTHSNRALDISLDFQFE